MAAKKRLPTRFPKVKTNSPIDGYTPPRQRTLENGHGENHEVTRQEIKALKDNHDETDRENETPQNLDNSGVRSGQGGRTARYDEVQEATKRKHDSSENRLEKRLVMASVMFDNSLLDEIDGNLGRFESRRRVHRLGYLAMDRRDRWESRRTQCES